MDYSNAEKAWEAVAQTHEFVGATHGGLAYRAFKVATPTASKTSASRGFVSVPQRSGRETPMPEFVWNNMAFSSEEEMLLAREIPSIYLDRWSDAGNVAEAILASDWLAARDRENRENRAIGWDEGWEHGNAYAMYGDNEEDDRTNPYRGDNQ